MTKPPIIEVHGTTDNDLERADWVRSIFAAACQHVRDSDEPVHEACYWPGSIVKMEHIPEIMTIYWSDALSMFCFLWAFKAAWDDLGDDTPVEHVAMDELDGDERESFEAIR